MGKLFYGTQTGTTEGVARMMQQIAPDLIEEIKCVQYAEAEELQACDLLVLGGATWGDGELTDDWQIFWPKMDQIDFSGKFVSLFGLGDAFGYPAHFVSSMRMIYDKVIERGGTVIADEFPREDFEFEHSESLVNDKFIGLVIDEINQSEFTEQRIQVWADYARACIAAYQEQSAS
jgi:flavodoxin I